MFMISQVATQKLEKHLSFEKKTTFMFKYFQAAKQKVKKKLNLNSNMAFM